MDISVDLPAPFSPSSACTSPRRRSKSTPSFATTAPNLFVMPRSSSASCSSGCVGVTSAGRPDPRSDLVSRPPASRNRSLRSLFHCVGDVGDLARLDVGCDLVELGGVLLARRVQLAEADAAVGQRVDDVLTGRE